MSIEAAIGRNAVRARGDTTTPDGYQSALAEHGEELARLHQRQSEHLERLLELQAAMRPSLLRTDRGTAAP